jgi:glucan-binding YG repeat protein
MKTGWQKIGGKYYYLGSASDGKMVTGKQKIGGKTYTFNSNGVWIK